MAVSWILFMSSFFSTSPIGVMVSMRTTYVNSGTESGSLLSVHLIVFLLGMNWSSPAGTLIACSNITSSASNVRISRSIIS